MVGKRAAAAYPRLLAAAFVVAQFSSIASATNEAGKRELTPADAIATVRVIQNQLLSGQPAGGGFTSPDGKRYLIRLVYGDVGRNGVWMDLLTGPLDSLESAARPKHCAHLFTTGLGSTTSARSAEADPDPTNVIRWVDATHVAFLWSDEHAIRQVMSVDLTTCKHQFLTHAAGDVFSFLPVPDGTLLLNTQIPAPTGLAEQLWAHGFTVGDASDGISILQGHIEDSTAVEVRYKNAWAIQAHGRVKSLDIDGHPFDPSNPYSRDLSLGLGGCYAVTWIGVTSRPQGWEAYSNPSLQAGLTSTDKPRLPVRYVVIDLHTGESRMLWNAPLSVRAQVHWSPSGDAVLLAPTYLPVDVHNPLGLTGNAAAEISVRTGEYRLLPIDLTDRTVLKAEWSTPGEIAITSTNTIGEDLRTERFARSGETWQAAPNADPDASDTPPAPIRLETRQSLNAPPQIFAVDTRSGKSQLVIDPNPHLLDDFKLGRVERMSGVLPTGQHWIAQLIYPADYRPDVKYPLVIQSAYGPAFGAEEFSLEGAWGFNGMGLGPTQVPSNPGQLLATRNIAVLELEVLHPAQGFKGAEDRQLAFEALSRQLASSGLVDESKIALAGFSQNGYWVEYTLAHSAFPFAAAIAGDNYEPSYFQSALGNWREMDVKLNGGAAFGNGLQEWLAHAPGFNAEHIHTPLLIAGQSGGLLMIISEWEIYSRMRHLNKPAQIYMMPQADKHPSHTPQNPEQIIAIQDAALDWFDFWLTGREDASPKKREQYARWHRLLTSTAVPNP
jgi:hypothetical protein